MPVITLYGPKLTKEQKAEIVKLFTEAASKVTNIPAQAFIVQIQEMDRENV
ncbi:MAG: 4-oxalocrotonate tautomerase DmpI, partial [Bacillota bacterium]